MNNMNVTKFADLKVDDTKSKLSFMINEYAGELLSGKGFEVGFVYDIYSQRELDALDEWQKYALTMRKEAYFYDMFDEFDKIHHFMVDEKLIKVNNIPNPEKPMELIRLMVETAFDRRERRSITEHDIHNVFDSMGGGLYLYYQGLLYEYYCYKVNKDNSEEAKTIKEQIIISIRNLFNGAGQKMYLYDNEELDFVISSTLHEVIEKAGISEKYCKRMNRVVEVLNGLNR